MKVRFKQGRSKYTDLTPGNIYRVIGIEADHYRLMNDFGQPYLYLPRFFKRVDASIPSEWQTVRGEDGERYSYPAELMRPGFFEDYFDGNRKAMATLHRYLASTMTNPSRRRIAG